MGVMELFFMFIMIVIGIGGTLLWIWTLIDCVTNEPSEGNDKLIWIVLILFSHFVGSLIYLLMRRPQRIQRFGK